MKIGIDARFYGPRVGGGGLGRYVAELIDHLQAMDTKHEYVLFLKKENFHECVITNPRFYKRMVDVPWYTLQEQRVLPQEVRQAHVDFMHYPHWNIPIFSRTPFLVTIHDLILLEQRRSARATTRGPLVYGFKYAGFRTVLESAIHRSKHILTVSEYTKQAILDHFGVKEEKITVTPNGVLPARSVPHINLQELGIRSPFFLYVGNAYPHKNLEMLMHAFSEFLQQFPHAQLVIAGRRDAFSRKLEKEAQEIGIQPEQVRFMDFPSDDELAALYAKTDLFIFPSKIEGFGMPPLEAMSYGAPVAAANTSSLPEVLGNAAHFFDPDDIERLITIMRAAVEHPNEMRDFGKNGIEQAKKYTWRATAKKTLDVYNRFGTFL